MKLEEKQAIIDSLAEQFKEYSHFYLTDITELNAVNTSDLRRACFNQEIKMIVVKNTLLKRALDKSEKNFEEQRAIKRNREMGRKIRMKEEKEEVDKRKPKD